MILDVARMLAEHGDPDIDYRCRRDGQEWPCDAYLAAEEAQRLADKVERVQILVDSYAVPGFGHLKHQNEYAEELRFVLADPEQEHS